MEARNIPRDSGNAAVRSGETSGRDLDPEYQDLLSQQNKQQRLVEHGGRYLLIRWFWVKWNTFQKYYFILIW